LKFFNRMQKGNMSRLWKSLTFSNVIALLALFIALGGSVYAASNKIDGSQIKAKSLPGNRLMPESVAAAQLKKGSIGEAQLKANAVNGKQIKAGAVSAGKIAKNTITGTQVKAGSLEGAQIKAGSLGATQINQTTLTGISAANIHTVQYVTSTVAIAPETETTSPAPTSATATCPVGMKVIGGGANVSNPKFGSAYEAAPNAERSGWTAFGYAYEPNVSLTVTAICTPVAAPAG
jgi:hypothetical protein